MTHEEMLEVAAQRETGNSQKLEIKKLFGDWFDELVGFSFRSEWFYDDFDYAAKTNDYEKIVKWLQTAYEMGYNASESKLYGGTD